MKIIEIEIEGYDQIKQNQYRLIFSGNTLISTIDFNNNKISEKTPIISDFILNSLA